MSDNIIGFSFFLFFLFFGINYPLGGGLYIHDVFMFFCLFLYFQFKPTSKYLIFKLEYIYFFIFSFFPFFIVAVFDNISYSSFDSNSFFLPFKIIWLSLVSISFLVFLDVNLMSKKIFYFMVFAIVAPVLISLLMYVSPPIEQVFLSVYHREKYPSYLRFGGIFGKDVNMLGMYSSLTLILSFILMLHKKHILGAIVFTLSLVAIVTSGMRTGLLVITFLSLASVFFKSFRIFPPKKIIIAFSVFCFFIIFIFFNLDYSIRAIIVDRFSLIRLLSDLTYGESGNLTHASKYFEQTLQGYDLDWFTPFVGYDSKLMFVDNMFVFLFLKYGMLSIFLYILWFVYSFFITKDSLVRFLLLFSIIVSLKGVFVFGNAYIYLSLFIIFIHKYLDRRSLCLDLKSMC